MVVYGMLFTDALHTEARVETLDELFEDSNHEPDALHIKARVETPPRRDATILHYRNTLSNTLRIDARVETR